MSRYVYYFGAGHADGTAQMKTVLGGKGANLAEMTNLGIPVPPGFTISAELCNAYIADRTYPPELKAEVEASLKRVEEVMGRKFGAATKPLLVSVRSGAAVSMPGMMDTILNLGLNDAVAAALATETGNPQFAYDSYRRFVQMYGDVVLGLKGSTSPFEPLLAAKKKAAGRQAGHRPAGRGPQGAGGRVQGGAARSAAVEASRRIRRSSCGARSRRCGARGWATARSRTAASTTSPRPSAPRSTCRRWSSATSARTPAPGVAFTRDPSTGEKQFFGEFLVNAQGEDVVAGIRTPRAGASRWLEKFAARPTSSWWGSPDASRSTTSDMQDIEFTIEHGKLYMLQTRNGKRTGARGGARSPWTWSRRADRRSRRRCCASRPDAARPAPAPDDRPEGPERPPLAKGLPASPGRGGRPDRLHRRRGRALGERRASRSSWSAARPAPRTSTAWTAAQGILTARGGMTSHAAVVARGMGKCCVAGCERRRIDGRARDASFTANGTQRSRTATGSPSTAPPAEVIRRPGAARSRPTHVGGDFETAHDLGRQASAGSRVRTNADTPARRRSGPASSAPRASALPHRAHVLRGRPHRGDARDDPRADNGRAARKALAKLLPMQRSDFVGIFKAMDGLPVTIRLLDPPLHEFLPHERRARSPSWRKRAGHHAPRRSTASVESAARGQPDARPPRLPPRHHLPRDHRDAGAGHHRGRGATCKQGRCKVMPEIMIPLVGDRDGARRTRPTIVAARRRARSSRRPGAKVDLPGRHDDRDPARRADRRRDRRGGRVLLLRHQRPDPDDLRLLPRRRRHASCRPTSSRSILPDDPFQALDQRRRRPARARSAIEQGPRHAARTSRSASAASTAATRRASMFCHKVGPELRVLLAVPRADRPAGRGAGRAQGEGRRGSHRRHGVRSGAAPAGPGRGQLSSEGTNP